MRFQIDHDLHIPSYLSTCSSDPEQTPDAIDLLDLSEDDKFRPALPAVSLH